MTILSTTITAILLMGMVSCNNADRSASGDTEAPSERQDAELDLAAAGEAGEAAVTPFTDEDFKKAFPPSINGLPMHGAVRVAKQQGLAYYGNGALSLAVFDCTGGNTNLKKVFAITYATKVQDDEDTKHINEVRDGIETIATYKTDTNESTLVFLHRKRWYVVLKSKNSNPDELWAVLDSNDLENFK